jgi:isoleucyl-tRNA synthetase
VDDPSVVVAFRAKEFSLLAWTTTPWTLPSNLALMICPTARYAKVLDLKSKKIYVLAESRIGAYFKGDYEVLGTMMGSDLIGMNYEPLFPFFAHEKGAFRVIGEEAVSVEEGTGIVHAAPAFGELDFYAAKREGIEPVSPVDASGRFTLDVPPYAGMYVKDADREILQDLKRRGLLFDQATIRHRYPFCWRSDTPLIYKAVNTWFVAVEKIKERLLEANDQIRWVPSHIKEGRFGKWLENARDWAISRNRYWGTPIPIFRNHKGDLKAVGSIEELERLSGRKVEDLHRHHIDHLELEGGYKRIPEVFDCWFESGSMPYASIHYPFENKEAFEAGFPAHFIAEGLDQTRGWFYTLTVLSAALFDRPAFQNVIVNGIILAEDGNKMSKRLKNYPEPERVINQYGADAIRLYLLGSPVVKGDDLRFSEKGVEQVLRQVLIPVWNGYQFYTTYAKIADFKATGKRSAEPIDRWILSISARFISEVEKAMELYEVSRAVEALAPFVDQLTNWYIRRSRSRFWNGEKEALETLHQVLTLFAQGAAPFIPFLSEAIWQGLGEKSTSVHLTDWPKTGERDSELEEEMAAAQKAVSLGHAVRKEHKLKVRQPLKRAYLITSNQMLLERLAKQKAVIGEELNVKEVVFRSDEASFVKWQAKPHFPSLGKKVGKWMPEAKQKIEAFTRGEIEALEKGGYEIELGGVSVLLHPSDVQIERKGKEGLAVKSEADLSIALDTELTHELVLEGLARELVNRVNTLRRDEGLEVTDRIEMELAVTPLLKEALALHEQAISGEVLAREIRLVSPREGLALIQVGEEEVGIWIKKVEP